MLEFITFYLSAKLSIGKTKKEVNCFLRYTKEVQKFNSQLP